MNPEIEIGHFIEGNEVIEITNTVNGKATYGSTFICTVNSLVVNIITEAGADERNETNNK